MPNFFPADFIDYKNMNSYAAVHYKNLNPYAAVPPPAALVLVRPGVPAPSPGGSGTRVLRRLVGAFIYLFRQRVCIC